LTYGGDLVEAGDQKGSLYPPRIFQIVELVIQLFNYHFDTCSEVELWSSGEHRKQVI
jgi:hypothetical protein